ncbi:head-tail adaptor protein [uncultured Roseobacter sp.]|uniref:head-tail adaptor protein n=1 Tax=uncultured Roseobacter sp. TaxID=114847 RepID=UPI00262CFC1F|nr:head-tail adaptor protein [uncultured Roseobacter sp.]
MNLRERVIFDQPTTNPDGAGGQEVGWTSGAQSHECRAQFIYSRGNEAVDAARLEGRAMFKIKIRSCVAARAITPAWRMRDARRDEIYNVVEADAITDPAWVYIVAESGVSV